MTDWTGNKNSVFKTLGASNHTEKERTARAAKCISYEEYLKTKEV